MSSKPRFVIREYPLGKFRVDLCWQLDEAPEEQDEPTTAMPGSAEKIEIMRRRVEEGKPPHSKGDRCTFGDDRDPDAREHK